jgi:hypothetical protein
MDYPLLLVPHVGGSWLIGGNAIFHVINCSAVVLAPFRRLTLLALSSLRAGRLAPVSTS